MRGQASVELLIIAAAVLVVAASLLTMGGSSNEGDVVLAGARLGADNAIAGLGSAYGCSIDVETVGFEDTTVTISLIVRGAQPDNATISAAVRDNALAFIHYAVHGGFPLTPEPVSARYGTYNVSVSLERVSK